MSERTRCSCSTELAILKNELENRKMVDQLTKEAEDRRFEEYKRSVERWMESQDKRIDKLELNDDNFHRDATSKERTSFGIWITIVASVGTAVVGAILPLLLGK